MKMKRVQLSDNLWLDEYIPKSLYIRPYTKGDYWYGREDAFFNVLIRKLNERLIFSDQMLRNKFGPVTLNNWWNGGRFNERGLRVCGTSTGAELSDHFQGNASDKVFKNATAEEVRDYIKLNWKVLGITIIEADTNWVHSSVAWVLNQKSLLIVPIPKKK